MNCPCISVIIPTRNNGEEIHRAIRSVLSQDALVNHWCKVDIIVINDASDNSHALLQLTTLYPVCRLFHLEEQTGPAAARNYGIKQATGEFITFLDADDEWPENKLSMLLPLFEKPELEVAGGKVKYLVEEGLPVVNMRYEDDQNRITHVHLGALLVKKSVFEKKLFFDESLTFSEDVDWWFRLKENRISIALLEETTLLYHIHGKNMSVDKNLDELKMLKVLHQSIQRRKNSTMKQQIPQISDFRVQQADPLISIVLPLYNGKKFIKRTIESVRSQSYTHWELLVIDDGSTDGGGAYVREHFPEIQVFQQKNAGVAAARNKGIHQAKGDVVAFLDQDDEWLPDKLRLQWEALKSDPYCAFVTCNQIFLCHEGFALPANFDDTLKEEHRGFVPSVLLVRKHALISINNFDESLETASDFDLIRKLRNAGFGEKNVDQLLLKKWYHEENASLNTSLMRRELLSVLHRQIKRQ